MKRTISLLSILAFLLTFSGNLLAQEPVNVSANVLAEIVTGTTVDVSFGDIDPNSTPVLDPNGTDTDIISGTLGKIPVTSAEASTQLVIDWNQTTITLGDGGTETITFTPDVTANSTDDASASSDVTKNTASAATATSGSGVLFIYIGGDLGTLTNQAAGNYTSDASNGSGDLEFTISYL